MKKIRKVLEFILALLNFLFTLNLYRMKHLPSALKVFLSLIIRILKRGMNLYLRLSVRVRLW